jgi:hypothetical protein
LTLCFNLFFFFGTKGFNLLFQLVMKQRGISNNLNLKPIEHLNFQLTHVDELSNFWLRYNLDL